VALIIEKFRPPLFHKHNFDLQDLNQLFNKSLQYAAMGRYALYHILKSLNIKGKILIPAYICHTILWPLDVLNIEPVFYDVDPRDLNANIDSIKELLQYHQIQALLVASMYGNPADLPALEALCAQYDIDLIDDAAQSFGAFLDDRPIGSYGQAGFFALSPGKPTAGHMGAFFWTVNEDYAIPRTSNAWAHFLTYLDFYFNRLYIYRTKSYKFFKALEIGKRCLQRFVDFRDDEIAPFEKNIIGGIINDCLTGNFSFRQYYMEQFCQEFSNNDFFRIIKAVRGKPHNHKLVLILSSCELVQELEKHLSENKIFFLKGYSLLTNQLDYLPNCRNIDGRIIELPIENDDKKMRYLFKVLHKFRG